MTTLHSPSTAEEIIAQVTPVIREYAAVGEVEHRLAPQVVEAMIDAGVFRCWIPRALGGLEMDPLPALRMFEGIAHADGSAGWVASNSSNVASAGAVGGTAVTGTVVPAGVRPGGCLRESTEGW